MADHSRMMNFHSSILKVASLIKNNEQKKAENSFEMEKKKRERKANYSREETDRLVALVLLKKDILENKKNGADQWQEKKQAWEEIEKDFNRNSDRTNYRNSKCLKIKYECLKRDIKKKWSHILANKRNADGKLPKFSEAEKKIKDILPLQVKGFYDFSSMNDKSEDEDDSSNSSNSDSNTNYEENRQVKREKETHSEEETTNFETNDLVIDYHSLSDGEPPNKKMHEDPLTGKNSLQNKSINVHINLEEEKLKLEVEMLKEELEMKKMQRKLMEEEIVHKRTIRELEKQHLLLKIETLKKLA